MKRNRLKNIASIIIVNLILLMAIIYCIFNVVKSVLMTEHRDAIDLFEKLPIFNHINYVLPLVVLIVLLLVIILFPAEKHLKKHSLKSFWRFNKNRLLAGISICVSLGVIGTVYPNVPSIASYTTKAEERLKYNLTSTSDEVAMALAAGDYKYLNDIFVVIPHDLGDTHMQLVPNNDIKSNISSLSTVDSTSMRPTTHITSKGNPVLPEYEKITNSISLDDSSSIYWEYNATSNITEVNRIGFSVDITGPIGSCYFLYYQTSFEGDSSVGIAGTPNGEPSICLKDVDHKKSAISAFIPQDKKIDKLSFGIKPQVLSTVAGQNKWTISNENIFMGRNGSEKNISSYCIEGFYDGSENDSVYLEVFRDQSEHRYIRFKTPEISKPGHCPPG